MLATELAAFVDGVRRGAHPGVVTLNDARNGLRATDAILRSLATGGRRRAMILADAHLHLFRHGFPGVYGRSLLAQRDRRLRGLPREARHRRRADRRLPGRRHRPGEQRLYPRTGRRPARGWRRSPMSSRARCRRPATVEALIAAGHAGLAIYVPDDGAVAALSAWDAATWRALDAHGAIVSFNIGLPQIGILAAIAAAAPRCRLISSHMGMPGTHRETPTPRRGARRTRTAAVARGTPQRLREALRLLRGQRPVARLAASRPRRRWSRRWSTASAPTAACGAPTSARRSTTSPSSRPSPSPASTPSTRRRRRRSWAGNLLRILGRTRAVGWVSAKGA